MFERIKSTLNLGGREKRYPDPDQDFQDPEAHEDPHTTPDSTRMTLGEFLSQNMLYIFSLLVLLLIGAVLLAVYASRYFITTLSNPWVQRLLAGLSILSLGYFYGRAQQRSDLKNRDELVLYDPDESTVTRFLGEWQQAANGNHAVFEPIKGFSLLGHRAEPYRISDLSSELVTKYQRDPEDPVRIRIHPIVAAMKTTNTGRKTVQLTAGLEPDPFGRESNVVATLPTLAGEDTVDDLRHELEQTAREKRKLESENDMLERQRDDAMTEARKARQTIRSEIGDTMEMIEPLVTRQRREPDADRRNGHSDEPRQLTSLKPGGDDE